MERYTAFARCQRKLFQPALRLESWSTPVLPTLVRPKAALDCI